MNLKLKKFFKGKTLLITGGTGSFGKQFTKNVLSRFNIKKIIIFSRDELKQSVMSDDLAQYKDKLRFFIGDVRDLNRLKLAMKGVDYVVHTAALKQVPAAEYNPFEVIKTNIIGTQNVVDAIVESNVQKAISLSTDKAAAPINLYGATKLTADKIFISSNNYSSKKFSVVRYGNVFGSRGSVIPVFQNQIKKGYIEITDKRMTRFSITLDEAVNFVISKLYKMWGGELFVPKIPSYRLADVAKIFSNKIKIIGLRPGEKLHEEMITTSDSLNTVEFKDYYVILPTVQEFINWKVKDFLIKFDKTKGNFCEENFTYNSLQNKNYLSIDRLKKLIKNFNV